MEGWWKDNYTDWNEQVGGWKYEQMAGWVNRETNLVFESPAFL